MGKNKRIKKRIEGLKRAKKEHQKKIEEYEGEDEYLVSYWEKEIENIDENILKEKRKFKKN